MNGHRYRVIWRRLVLDRQVGQFLDELADRGESTDPLYEAMSAVEELLAVRPATRGESRGDSERVLVEGPLWVTFEVFEDERVVVVLHAHYRHASP